MPCSRNPKVCAAAAGARFRNFLGSEVVSFLNSFSNFPPPPRFLRLWSFGTSARFGRSRGRAHRCPQPPPPPPPPLPLPGWTARGGRRHRRPREGAWKGARQVRDGHSRARAFAVFWCQGRRLSVFFFSTQKTCRTGWKYQKSTKHDVFMLWDFALFSTHETYRGRQSIKHNTWYQVFAHTFSGNLKRAVTPCWGSTDVPPPPPPSATETCSVVDTDRHASQFFFSCDYVFLALNVCPPSLPRTNTSETVRRGFTAGVRRRCHRERGRGGNLDGDVVVAVVYERRGRHW